MNRFNSPDSDSVNRNRFRFLDALGEATRPLSAPADIMAITTRLLGEYLHATRAAYADVEPDNDHFILRYDWTVAGAESNIGKYRLSLFGPRTAASLRAGRTLVIRDVDTELAADEGAEMFDAIGVKAIVCCPLVKNSRLIAMMAVESLAPRTWTATEIALVEEVAERSWSYIERGRSQMDLRTAERRNARLAAQLQLALDSAGLGTWRVDLVARLLITDARFRAIFGTSAERLELQEAAKLVHADDLERVRAAIQAAIHPVDPQPYDVEYRVVHPDGAIRWVRTTGRANFRNRGAERLMVSFDGTIADISERKRVEERERQATAQALAMAEANAKFRTFFEQGSYFAGVMSLDGTVIEANRLCLDACGFTREQIIGKKFWECGWWNRSSALVEMIRAGTRQAADGLLFRRETRYFIADGSERIVDLILAPVTDDNGRVLFIAPTGVDITDRKAIEADLRETRARLEATLAAAEIGTWTWDIAADRVTPDRNLIRLFSLSGADAEGSSIASYIGAVHPDDRELVMTRIRRAIASGRPYEARYQVRHPDGSYRHVIARGKAEYDANGVALRLPGVLVDITQQQQAEKELQVSEERYRTLIELMDEGFCIIELLFDDAGRPVDYRFVETNPAFLKHTGLVDAVGKTVLEMVPGHDRHWFEIYGRVALTGEPERFVNEARAMNRWYDTYATRVGGPDSRRVAVLFKDITERKRAEDDLRRLAFSLAEVDQRKTEFLATLAHELRNPLAPIQSSLDLMRLAPGNNAVAARTREIMERQLGHMIHLVNDLLDMARISRGQVDLKKQEVDLNDILAGAVETSMPLIKASEHDLTVRLPDAPIRLHVDPTRIAQVVSNLLNNAAKYTPAGGRIELSARQDHGEIIIAVTDNGIGIPEQAQSTVFEMFAQIRTSKDRAQGGLGIGLSLVRRLIELHGGTVTASSPGPDKGSTFTVRLPLSGSRSQAGPVSEQDAAGSERAMAPLRVLVVDDNTDAADTLASLLAAIGHSTVVAHNGEQALREARRLRPDVVFIDIGMLGMDGYDTARALRQMPGLERIRLVALTGWGAETDRIRSREAGFDEHLTKPANLATVRKVLSGLAWPPDAPGPGTPDHIGHQ